MLTFFFCRYHFFSHFINIIFFLRTKNFNSYFLKGFPFYSRHCYHQLANTSFRFRLHTEGEKKTRIKKNVAGPERRINELIFFSFSSSYHIPLFFFSFILLLPYPFLLLFRPFFFLNYSVRWVN